MRLVRGLGGAVLWLLASVVGLVAVISCVTVILLPLGLPLLRVSRRLFTTATRLMLPKEVAHPVKSLKGSAKDAGSTVTSTVSDAAGKVGKRSRKLPWRRRRLGFG